MMISFIYIFYFYGLESVYKDFLYWLFLFFFYMYGKWGLIILIKKGKFFFLEFFFVIYFIFIKILILIVILVDVIFFSSWILFFGVDQVSGVI